MRVMVIVAPVSGLVMCNCLPENSYWPVCCISPTVSTSRCVFSSTLYVPVVGSCPSMVMITCMSSVKR